MPLSKEQEDALVVYKSAVANRTITAHSLVTNNAELSILNLKVIGLQANISSLQSREKIEIVAEDTAKQKLEEAFGIRTNYVEIVEEERFSAREG